MVGRLVRAPALHFLAIGGVLFVLSAWHAGGPVGAGRGRAWDADVLQRAALALGFDREDPAVRERLVRLGDFLGEESGAADVAAREAEARRLGLTRSDIVIRRHLVEMMRLAAAKLGPGDLPTPAELEAYYAEHAGTYREPVRVLLTHVYFSRERRGAAVEDDARALLAELRRTGVAPEQAALRGDGFLPGVVLGPVSHVQLERTFGGDVAAVLDDAPVHAWVGPLRSSYGLHLVWITARLPAAVPPLATVRTRVLHALLAERRAMRLRDRMEMLRARWGEGPPA